MTSEHGSNQPGSGERSRLALLSDADNVNPAHRTEIERRAAEYGNVVRRLGSGRNATPTIGRDRR